MSWPIVKLSDVCEVILGGTPRTNEPRFWNGDIPWVTPKDMRKNVGRVIFETERMLTKEGLNAGSALLPKGTLILSTRAPIGYLSITGSTMCTNQGCKSLVPAASVLVEYLYFNLSGRVEELNALGTGTTFKELSTSALKAFPIPLPSLPEQYDIVEELEWKLARLEKIEGNFRAMAETAAQASRSVLDETFRSLGAPIVKLGEVCETTSGGTPLKNVADYYDGGNIPWLRSGEVCQKDITKAKAFITTKGVEHSSAKWLPSDTVLVAMYGATAGQVGILRFPSTTNQAICGILPSKRFVPEFLYYAILAKKEFLISQAVGGAQPNISQQKIKALLLPLPPLWDQKQIVEELEWRLSRLEKVERLAQEGLTVCEQARRAILAEAFRQADGADVRQDCSAAGQAEPSAQ